MTSRRRAAIATAAVVAIGAIAAAATQWGGGSTTPNAAARSATTVAVVTTDLAETTPVNGTVGFADPSSLVEPAGVTPSALAKDQQAVAAAAQALAADQQALADVGDADALSGAQGQQAIATAQAALDADFTQLQADQVTLAADTTAVPEDQRAVAADQQKVLADQAALQVAQGQADAGQQKAAQAAHQAQAKRAGDAAALASAQAAQAADQDAAAAYQPTSKYTALPTVGQVIAPGQSLWSVDGDAVPLLTGTLTPWRAFAAGMSPGADVAALNHALIALGQTTGGRESDVFTTATATAIRRLQASLGLPQTGALALGAVFFEPDDVRVTTVHPQLGATVTGGAVVLDLTSTTPIVSVALSVGQTYLVTTGNAVQVTLPDASTTTGTVTAVGTVATAATDPAGGGGAGSSSTPSATVEVTIALDHATASGSLDKAPVSVSITNRSARHVLAVPTTALLALAGGGDAVEVVEPSGTHHLVAVTTGIFDSQSGLVQVAGSGLSAGQKVVAAA